MKKIKQFALILSPIDNVIENVTDCDLITYITNDIKDIISLIKVRMEYEEDFAKNYCIEEYYVNENDDFVEGSDYDSIENFLKRNLKED